MLPGTSYTQRGMYRGICSSMLGWAPIVRTTAVIPHTRPSSLLIEKCYEPDHTMYKSSKKYLQPLSHQCR